MRQFERRSLALASTSKRFRKAGVRPLGGWLKPLKSVQGLVMRQFLECLPLLRCWRCCASRAASGARCRTAGKGSWDPGCSGAAPNGRDSVAGNHSRRSRKSFGTIGSQRVNECNIFENITFFHPLLERREWFLATALRPFVNAFVLELRIFEHVESSNSDQC